jgi:hypothetical protein
MSVWDLYCVMTTTVSLKNTLDLVCRAESAGDTAVFEWAEEREAALDDELQVMAANLAARLDLSVDDEDTRDMAFARIDGYVPSGMWSDGRLLRMQSARDLRKKAGE